MVIGALIGHIVAKQVVHAHEAKSGFYLSPGVDPYTGAYTISTSYRRKQPNPKMEEYKECTANKRPLVAVEDCLHFIFEAK